MKKALGLLLIALPLLSAFMWAAFNYSWWEPGQNPYDGRIFLLYILHCMSLVVGLAIIMFSDTKE